MSSILGALVRTGLNLTIGVPVSLVQDLATMGGACTGQNEPYTVQMLEQIKREADPDYRGPR